MNPIRSFHQNSKCPCPSRSDRLFHAVSCFGGGGGDNGKGGKGPTAKDGDEPDDRGRHNIDLGCFLMTRLALLSGLILAVAGWKVPSAVAASASPSSHAKETPWGGLTTRAPLLDAEMDLGGEDTASPGVARVASSPSLALSDDISRLKRLQRELFARSVELKQRLDDLEAEKGAHDDDSFIPSQGSGVNNLSQKSILIEAAHSLYCTVPKPPTPHPRIRCGA